MNPVAQRGKNQPKRREVAANPRVRVRAAPTLAHDIVHNRHKEAPHDSLFDGIMGMRKLFQVLDLNQRSLRDGFTVRSLCPLGQPGSCT